MDNEKILNEKRHEQLPWIEKYRPYNIDDICLPQLIKNKISNIIKDRNLPNIIFSGPPGIGKTSAIKIMALSLYGKYYKDAVLELGLLEDRGIKFMQNDIVLFCKTKISYKKEDEDKYPKYKLIIFDEADNIISRVQDQISVIMESYSNNIRFALTCNSSSEISEGIQTKSLIWRYPALSDDLVIKRLGEICNKENIKFNESALKKVCNLSQGDLRTAINKLELIANKYSEIKDEYINDLCNTPQEIIIKKIFLQIINKKLKEALEMTFDLKKKSYSGSDIVLGMLTTIKSDICNDISEIIKIKLSDQICKGIYYISNITDSDLQLAGCIVDMVEVM
jgi:replication factor C subunit 2/4